VRWIVGSYPVTVSRIAAESPSDRVRRVLVRFVSLLEERSIRLASTAVRRRGAVRIAFVLDRNDRIDDTHRDASGATRLAG